MSDILGIAKGEQPMTGDLYSRYIASPQWQRTRNAALRRSGYRCTLCNAQHGLQVHHRTYDRLGAELPDDLIVLCRDCHSAHHERIGGSAPANQRLRFALVGELYRVDSYTGSTWNGDTGNVIRWQFAFRGWLPEGIDEFGRLGITGDDLIPVDTWEKYHPNGTPWGGSAFRIAIEALLDRPLCRRERVPRLDALCGRRCVLETTALSRSEKWHGHWKLRALSEVPA